MVKSVDHAKVSGASKKGNEPPKRVLKYSLHWQLNSFTFSILGLVYWFLPKQFQANIRLAFALMAVDASRYYYLQGSMAGVPYTLPLVTVVAMLVFPVKFWAEMASIAMESEDGICTNILVRKFLIFCTDPKVCRDILTGEGIYGIYAHPNAKWLFGEANLIYLEKNPHKALKWNGHWVREDTEPGRNYWERRLYRTRKRLPINCFTTNRQSP